jgi:hypothetical protein
MAENNQQNITWCCYGVGGCRCPRGTGIGGGHAWATT